MRLAASEACPARCTCGQQSMGYRATVYCANQQRTGFPTDLPPDTDCIMIQGNNITEFTFPSLPNLRKLDIKANQLRTIEPFRNLPALETLILSDNNIASLDAGTFAGMPALRHLDLQRNMITDLADGVFSGLTLESLWLTSNRLTSIGSNTFEGSSVVNLIMSGNAIGSTHENAFAPLKSSLKRFICNNNRQKLKFGAAAFRGVNLNELYLAYSRLHDDTSFLEHVNTIRLDLSGNRLPLSSLILHNYTSLSKVQDLRLRDMSLTAISSELLPNSTALRMIDLSENKIKAVTRESFKFVTQLTSLVLDYNLLSRLPEALIDTMPHLHSLSISSNRIYRLEASELTSYAGGGLRLLDMQSNRVFVIEESLRPLLNKIGTFLFNGNPLHCNCELLWYRDWLTRQMPNKHALNARCVTPSRGNIVKMPDSSFACTVPQIAYVTTNVNRVDEGGAVFLTCSAVADPAPVVNWTSPSGERISITTPPQDRRRTKTIAEWRVASISRSQAGLYRCMATNLKGQIVVSVCVGVLIPGSKGTVCDGSSTIASTERPAQSANTLRTEMTLTSTGTPGTSTKTLRTEMTPPSSGTPAQSTNTLPTEMITTAASSFNASSTITGVTTYSLSPAPPSLLLLTILALLIVVALIMALIHMTFMYIRRRRLKRSSDISTGLDSKRRHGTKTKSSGNEMSPLLANTCQ